MLIGRSLDISFGNGRVKHLFVRSKKYVVCIFYSLPFVKEEFTGNVKSLSVLVTRDNLMCSDILQFFAHRLGIGMPNWFAN